MATPIEALQLATDAASWVDQGELIVIHEILT
jgi:hypothetical protein